MTSLHKDQAAGPRRLTALRSAETCLSEQEIEDYIFERLSGSTVEALELHYFGCPTCAERLEAAQAYAEAARSAAAILESEDRASAPERVARRQYPPLLERFAQWWSRPWGLAPRLGLVGALAVLVVAIVVPLTNSTEVAYTDISLVTQRGAANPLATTAAQDRLRLHIDLTELQLLASYHVELVDAGGVLVREATLAPKSRALEWDFDHLAPGQYWVRLADGRSGNMLREYGLVVAKR